MEPLVGPRLVIGIAGGSGSGKTTLVQKLMNGPFGSQIALLSQDAYFRELSDLPMAATGEKNWDHPDSLDNTLFLKHIDQLLSGHPIDEPVYDYVEHKRLPYTIDVHPLPVLVLEGIHILAVPDIRNRIDIRVFIDTPADLRVVRRAIRDINQRGRSVQSVASQYQQTVRPMHEQYVEPSRHFAHVVIPWIIENEVAIDLLTARIAVAISGLSILQNEAE